MTIRKAMYECFTDNPINWVKWGIVFAVLILGHVFTSNLFDKVKYLMSYERKRDIAQSKGHVIEATLVRCRWYDGKFHALYHYRLGEENKSYGLLSNYGRPPEKINLYYIHRPNRFSIFAVEGEHWDQNFRGLPVIFVNLLPWFLAMLAAAILHVETGWAQL